MVEGRWRLGFGRQGGLVEALFENGFDAFIGTGPDLEGAPARGFEALSPVALAQTHNAQARTKTLLGMGTRLQNGFHHPRGRHAARGRPLDESLRSPLGIMAVGFGHVHGHRAMAPLEVGAPVASHPLAFVQQLHDVGCEPHIELLFDQRLGPRVVMPLDLNMVIDIDPGTFPLGVCIRVGW